LQRCRHRRSQVQRQHTFTPALDTQGLCDDAQHAVAHTAGDTAAIVRSYTDIPILCIEGHPGFCAILGNNLHVLGSGISLESSFVNVTDGIVQGHWEFARGTARLVSDRTASVPARSLTDILEDHPDFQTPSLLKIDTDGMDCTIIEAEIALLERHRPVLFFEYDPSFYAAEALGLVGLAAVLSEIGYSAALVYDNLGYYMTFVALEDSAAMEALDVYVRSLTTHSAYVDICVFHSSDAALAEFVHTNELDFSKRYLRGETTAV
jgi:FkbM family methyltransferase